MSGPLPFYDRVKETATTTGTGTFTLAGAATGYQSFAAVGNGNTCYYVIAHQTLTEWECGVGTYTSAGTTLARTAITSSSNSGSAVNFSAGTKDVFISPIADFLNGAVRWQEPVGMRLSLASNTYINTANATGAGTLYWTPVLSSGTGVVTGYNGSAIARKTVTEKNISLTLTSGKLYDVFYDYDGDALALSAAWTDDVTRADALANEQGAIVLGSDHTKLWLGTLYATGTNVVSDTTQNRHLWNAYNQVERHGLVIETTDSWTYTTNTWRSTNASALNQVNYVSGAIGTLVRATSRSQAATNSINNYAAAGVGIDSTSVNSATTFANGTTNVNSNCMTAEYQGYPGLGYHAIHWLEISQAAAGGFTTTTWYGDAGLAADIQNGMVVRISGM